MRFTDSKTDEGELQVVEQNFAAVAKRAEQLREICPYRFYKMTPEKVRNWLDEYYIPMELGWKEEKIVELEEILSRTIPADYRIFLSLLGNLHYRLFGYDYDLRNPNDYLRIREDCLDYGEQWGEAIDDASFHEMMHSGIFLNTLGGFAVWYLSSRPDEPSSIKYWDEGDQDSPASIKLEAGLVKAIECRMTNLEHRVQHNLGIGGSLVYGSGGQLPVGHALDKELLEMPHTHFMVELSQSQKDKIQTIFTQTQL